MRRWHKYLGLATTFLVVLVSVTGILLIHRKDLGLNRIVVSVPGYAKGASQEAWHLVSMPDGKKVVATKRGIFATGADGWRRTLPASAKKLHREGDEVYACTTDGLQVSGDGGDSWLNLIPGEEVKALHFGPGGAVAVTVKGVYRRNGGGEWQLFAQLPGKGLDVREVIPEGSGFLLAAKEGLHNVSEGKVRPVKLPGGGEGASGVELQKLVTDLHTGAFFGGWFMLVIDLVALSLIFFAISGVWLWYVPWNKKRSVKRPALSN